MDQANNAIRQPMDSSFLMPKISATFRDHLNGGAK